MKRAMGILAAVIGLSGCGLIGFDDQESGDATIQGGGLTNQLLGSFPGFSGLNNFDLSQSQDFQNQNAAKGAISSVKLKSITLQITSPNSQDFSFLDTLDFYISADGNQARVAHREDISTLGLTAPNPTLDLLLDDVELKPYVEAGSMSLSTNASGRQPSNDVSLHLIADFHVTL